MKITNQNGISLIEFVIVMIIFGMLVVPLTKGFFSVSQSMILNEEVNTANNLTLACAEHILYKRRLSKTSTFTPSTNSPECDANTNFAADGNLSIIINTIAPLCPAGSSSCDEITITSNNGSGQTRSTISLFFVYN